jgi:hypothetical protein
MTHLIGFLFLLVLACFAIRGWWFGHWLGCMLMFLPGCAVSFVLILLAMVQSGYLNQADPPWFFMAALSLFGGFMIAIGPRLYWEQYGADTLGVFVPPDAPPHLTPAQAARISAYLAKPGPKAKVRVEPRVSRNLAVLAVMLLPLAGCGSPMPVAIAPAPAPAAPVAYVPPQTPEQAMYRLELLRSLLGAYDQPVARIPPMTVCTSSGDTMRCY